MADVYTVEEKQPGEVLTYTIEYAGKLATGETLTTVEFSGAIRVDTGADVTSAFLQGVVISGTKVLVTVKDGLDTIKYKVSGRIVTSTANKFDFDIIVQVKEY